MSPFHPFHAATTPSLMGGRLLKFPGVLLPNVLRSIGRRRYAALSDSGLSVPPDFDPRVVVENIGFLLFRPDFRHDIED